MKVAPVPVNEQERLDELTNSMILDSPPEPEFDSLTELASQICETPIAVISLVDSARQWFKSHYGLEECETSREIAFCSYTILTDEHFVVEDALQDERFRRNPLVMGPLQIRAYLGYPIISSKGHRLGSFAVIDQKPRKFSELHRQAVKTLAAQTLQLIELGRAAKELRLAFQTMNEGILIKSASGHVLDFNQRAVEILGIPFESLVGRNAETHDWEATTEDGLPLSQSDYPTMVAARERRPVRNFVHAIGAGENTKWIEVNSVPYIEPATNAVRFVVTTFQDITRLRRKGAAIVHRARMAAIGEMAAGVAHEVNNPLAIIVGHCAVLEGQIKKAVAEKLALDLESVQERTSRIQVAAMRASKIVNGLLNLSRDSTGDLRQRFKLETLVQDALQFSKERLRHKDVKLEVQEIPKIEIVGNSTELSQVFINLINNAYDAVKSSAHKVIRIQFQMVSRGEQTLLAISVSDTGCGIPMEVRDRIMQPFFTTKIIGQGTGLGLSVSKGIVERHGGQLYLASELSPTELAPFATKFTFEIPLPQPDKKTETKVS